MKAAGYTPTSTLYHLQSTSIETELSILKACLGQFPMAIAAINRRGQQIECHVTCVPLIHARSEVAGVVLVMEQKQRSGSIKAA